MDKGDAIVGQLVQATEAARLVWQPHELGGYRTTAGDFTFSVQQERAHEDVYILRISSGSRSESIDTRSDTGDTGPTPLAAQVNDDLKLLYGLARKSSSGRSAFFDQAHQTLLDLLMQ
ncbi:hypothetical protein Sipo8835_38340 [Streptomyces ipomoeae]|uniref:Uncharacterized protein n=1 Tax=Streptomyces ipomoeae TaxID=103232 RepID=A0AAE9AWE4_9ACTN|nr:hypothetical protein [Streptomyces ipomoeae]MDX2825854.1 hypothetical protein [Streptomyces ipomoeae]MDX2877733.1 hypothetical protein [Streptomyces ipomoeae]TQE20521.1 hypothetical protein Sipo8835_38340 [Streptomyces ipomoeae]TQE27924.1 hypothetical protein Sipo7851_31405 [Streptomyces ipomoeae]